METLKYSLTQSGSAFTEFEKHLPAEIGKTLRTAKGNKTKIMWVYAITIEWDHHATLAVGDQDEYELVQITTNAEGAEVALSDKDCFFKRKNIPDTWGTPASGQMREHVKRYPVNLPYTKDEMYIGIFSNIMDNEAAAVVELQIEYGYKYIPDEVLSRINSART
jgi:hypothetical protein